MVKIQFPFCIKCTLSFGLKLYNFLPQAKGEISFDQFESEQTPPPMKVSPNTYTTLENFTFFFILLSLFLFKACPSK